jgi:hypothetical protein
MDNKHRTNTTHQQTGGSTYTEIPQKDGRVLSMEKKTI